jgi:hypothetical protein
MTNPARCRKLWDLSRETLRKNIPGAFVECGVWKGGSSAVMGLAIRSAGQSRHLHLFDSFEGLPEPTEQDGASAKEYSGGRASGALVSVNQCKAGLEEVKAYLLGMLKLEPRHTHFHVGWFQDTLPKVASQLGDLALLRLDGDWYESTRLCLEHLYPLLSPGGVLILDDYNSWSGCKKATDEYRTKYCITEPIQEIGSGAVYWVSHSAPNIHGRANGKSEPA